MNQTDFECYLSNSLS